MTFKNKFHLKLALILSAIAIVITLLIGWHQYDSGGMFKGLVWIIFSILAVIAGVVAFSLGWLVGIIWMRIQFQKSGRADSDMPQFNKIGIFITSGILIVTFLAISSSIYDSYISSLIYNQKTSAEDLDDLAHNYWVRRSNHLSQQLARHVNVGTGTLEYFLEHPSAYVGQVVCANGIITPGVMQKCATGDNPLLPSGLARNPRITTALLEQLSSHKDSRVRTALAANPELAEELMKKLSLDENEYVRARLAYNQNISSELLDRLADDKTDIVRMRVAINKATKAETLTRLVSDTNKQVIYGVLNNINATPEILDILAGHKDEQIRKQAIRKQQRLQQIK